MLKYVVWQLVQGQSGGKPWIRIDNNNIIWRYCTSWGQSLTHLLVHAIFCTKVGEPSRFARV